MIETNRDFNDFQFCSSPEELNDLQDEFLENDEFIIIPRFLPSPLIDFMQTELGNVKSDIHRSYIPKHKKGGSIPRSILERKAPIFNSIYMSQGILDFFNLMSQKQLLHCPDHDLHACALYLYTQKGDHIDFHFDTSYYDGQRYTALLGVVNRSNSVLEYELFHKKNDKSIDVGSAAIEPGTLVFFNGDKLKHRVTPAAAGDERIVLTLEYVTNQKMKLTKKFVSSMKDAIAYFGFKKVFSRSKL